MAARDARHTQAEAEDTRSADPRGLHRIVTSKWTLVSIVLDDKRLTRICESLNGKGGRLSQADLIRTYLFMPLPQTVQHLRELTRYPE